MARCVLQCALVCVVGTPCLRGVAWRGVWCAVRGVLHVVRVRVRVRVRVHVHVCMRVLLICYDCIVMI